MFMKKCTMCGKEIMDEIEKIKEDMKGTPYVLNLSHLVEDVNQIVKKYDLVRRTGLGENELTRHLTKMLDDFQQTLYWHRCFKVRRAEGNNEDSIVFATPS